MYKEIEIMVEIDQEQNKRKYSLSDYELSSFICIAIMQNTLMPIRQLSEGTNNKSCSSIFAYILKVKKL